MAHVTVIRKNKHWTRAVSGKVRVIFARRPPWLTQILCVSLFSLAPTSLTHLLPLTQVTCARFRFATSCGVVRSPSTSQTRQARRVSIFCPIRLPEACFALPRCISNRKSLLQGFSLSTLALVAAVGVGHCYRGIRCSVLFSPSLSLGVTVPL